MLNFMHNLDGTARHGTARHGTNKQNSITLSKKGLIFMPPDTLWVLRRFFVCFFRTGRGCRSCHLPVVCAVHVAQQPDFDKIHMQKWVKLREAA